MLKNIQVLRALAASMVVLHHVLMGKNGYLLTTMSKYGFIGVDLFFVISGLVISHATKSKKRNLENAFGFLKRRFFRIYLGYWPFFFFTLLIRYIIDAENIFELNIIHSFLLFSSQVYKLVIPISWSLTYEIYFYLLFGTSLLIPIKYCKNIFTLLFIAILAINLFYPIKENMHLNFFISIFIIEFLSGSLISFYFSECKSRFLALICTLGFIISYYLGYTLEAKEGLYRLMTFGVGSFFMVLLAVIFENIQLNNAPNFIVTLGDSSYTIYLSHLMFLIVINASGLTDRIAAKGGFAIEIFSVLLLSLFWLFSIYYYRYIERKLYLRTLSISSFRFSNIKK